MWETLAKYTKPPSSISNNVPDERQSPKEKLRRPLAWLEPVKTGRLSGYVLTACGGYSISKDVSGESVSYTAWKCLPDLQRHGKPWKQMPVNLGCVTTRAEAEALCAADVVGAPA